VKKNSHIDSLRSYDHQLMDLPDVTIN